MSTDPRCPLCKEYGRPRLNCPECDGSGYKWPRP